MCGRGSHIEVEILPRLINFTQHSHDEIVNIGILVLWRVCEKILVMFLFSATSEWTLTLE